MSGHIQCTNCRRSGHTYKTCREPIVSVGIIAMRSDSHILMIQRKDSIGYIDFLRGKYDLADNTYIKTLVSGMSVGELELLRSDVEFVELWDGLWSSNGGGQQYQRDYVEAGAKYAEFKKNPALREILETAKGWPGPEWGFPKGRRQGSESEYVTAMREFEEETGLPPSKYVFISGTPIETTFVGTNGLTYKHKYYVARCEESTVGIKTSIQKKEIGQIEWVPLKKAHEYIRPESTGLAQVLKSLGQN